mgnify:CR=1 FL=1|tara:strand:+ start:201 stop:2180 length:1980 start_codon:yes stop_codon:yes gene_type:complete
MESNIGRKDLDLQDDVGLKNRLLGATTEIGAGIGTDFLTAGLLNPVTLKGTAGLSAVAYAGINGFQGAYTNYMVQKHLYGAENVNWGEILSSGALSAIPFMNLKAGKNVANIVGDANTVRRGLVGGAGFGLAGEQLRVGIDEQRLLNPTEAVFSAGVGGVLGGGFTAAGKRVNKVISDRNYRKTYLNNNLSPADAAKVMPRQGLQENDLLRGKLLMSLDQPNIPQVGTSEFNRLYVEPTIVESANMFKVLLDNHYVQGGMSPTTGRRFDWKGFARKRANNQRSVATKISTVPYYKIPKAWEAIRAEEMRKWNITFGPAMKNFKVLDEAGNLVPQEIVARRINLDHTFTLVQSVGMLNNTRLGGPMYNRIMKRVLERGYQTGDTLENLGMADPFSHAKKTTFFNKIAGESGEKWWNGQHRDTGYTRYEWMEGKARRVVNGKKKMVDIWDAKVRREKHVKGTGAAADGHMEVIEDWVNMIDEGDKILKSGKNFFEANETELDPFEVGQLLAEVDINEWSVPKLKQLINDAAKKGLGIPFPKKTERQKIATVKKVSPFLHDKLTNARKDKEIIMALIFTDKTGNDLKKEVTKVLKDQSSPTEFYRQLTLALDAAKPVLTREQEAIATSKLNRIRQIIYSDPTLRSSYYLGEGGGAGGALDDI